MDSVSDVPEANVASIFGAERSMSLKNTSQALPICTWCSDPKAESTSTHNEPEGMGKEVVMVGLKSLSLRLYCVSEENDRESQ
jgi:hypothetical protein